MLALLARGEVAAAVDAYGGDLLPGTNAPALTELARLRRGRRSARRCWPTPSPRAVLRYAELAPYDTEVVEPASPGSATAHHPATPLLKGRLAAAVTASLLLDLSSTGVASRRRRSRRLEPMPRG